LKIIIKLKQQASQNKFFRRLARSLFLRGPGVPKCVLGMLRDFLSFFQGRRMTGGYEGITVLVLQKTIGPRLGALRRI